METVQQQQTTRESTARCAAGIAAQLEKLGVDVRLRNRGADLAVQQAVDAIAAELERIAEKLKACAPMPATLRDQKGAHGHIALLEAKDRLTLLDGIVRHALSGAARPTFIGETARLKLSLAMLEAADVFAQKRRLLQQERHRVETISSVTIKHLEDRLAALVAAAPLK